MDDQAELLKRAQAGDSGAAWELVVQRALTSATAAEPDPTGLVPLKLRPIERRILPSVYRRLDRVRADLRNIFRQLVAGEVKWPLYLHGPVGTGKTLAALCLCDVADSAVYHTVEGLCNEVMDQTADWEEIAGKGLAVLDEIGERVKIGDLHYTTVKRFIDVRFNHAGRVAIFISNLEPKELGPMFDDRIASRLRAGTEFELTGKDQRRRE